MMPTINRMNEKNDKPTTGPYLIQKLTVAIAKLIMALNTKRNFPNVVIVIWVLGPPVPNVM